MPGGSVMATRIEHNAIDYGDEQAAMEAYLATGARRAATLGNRGPIRFGADGRIHRDILDAYWRCGFYVFEGVLGADELAEIEVNVRDVLDHAIGKTNATRPCLSNVDAEAGSAAARAKAPESRSWRVVPGVFGLAGASVAAPSDPIRVDRGRRSPCVCTAGRGRGASGVGEAVMRRCVADRFRPAAPAAPARSGPLRRGCGR